MKISRRLGIGYGILLCLFGAYSLFALERIGALADLADELHDDPHAVSLLVLRAEHHVQSVSVGMEHLGLEGDRALAAARVATIMDHAREVERIFASIEARRSDPDLASIAAHHAGQPEILIDTRHAIARWRDDISTAAALIEDGRMPEARTAVERDITGATRELLGTLDRLGEEAEDRAAELSSYARVTREASTGATLALLALVIVTAFALTLWLTVHIHDRMDEAEAEARSALTREREVLDELEHLRNGAADLASAVCRLTRQGIQASTAPMSHALRSMGGISRAVSGCGAAITDLGDSPRAFIRIATVIEDVADYANILAVNAALEAARAGDAGGGFQALSDEMRRLATTTKHAGRQVTTAAEKLESKLSAAAAITQIGRSQIDDAAEAVGHAGEAIDRLTRGMRRAGRRLATMSSENLATDQVNKSRRATSPLEPLTNDVTPSPDSLIHAVPGSIASGDGAVYPNGAPLRPEAQRTAAV